MGGSNYVCTAWWCGTVSIVATNNNRNILLNYTYSTSVPPKFNSYYHKLLSKSTNTITLKYDTGATGNYIRDQYSVILDYLQPTTTSPWVCLRNNPVIQPTHSGHLPLSTFLTAATQAHAYMDINSTNLLSKGKPWYYDCSALFTKKIVTIFNSDNTPLLDRKWNTYDVLWYVKMQLSQTTSSPTTPTNTNANYILRLDHKKYELSNYLYAATGYLTKSTFIQAINNGNFIVWPGLTANIIS